MGGGVAKSCHGKAFPSKVCAGLGLRSEPKSGAGPDIPFFPAPRPPPCDAGAFCSNWDPEHCSRFSHPERQMRACKFGLQCYQKSAGHLSQFVHPGDQMYRVGMVIFDDGRGPEFETLQQLFAYFDPKMTGQLCYDDFRGIFDRVTQEVSFADGEGMSEAWERMDTDCKGYINFSTFAHWADKVGMDWPVGVEIDSGHGVPESTPCHFSIKDKKCECANFDPYEDEAGQRSRTMCRCGHKRSCHRSLRSMYNLSMQDQLAESDYAAGSAGLCTVEDEDLLEQLQSLMDHCHKATDNWTRDRGCRRHGVNACPDSGCAYKHKASVPVGYTLVRAQRNNSRAVWMRYALTRQSITDECSRKAFLGEKAVDFEPYLMDSSRDLGQPLRPGCNEWRLFHGTGYAASQGICQDGFRVSLAGTGATWKEPDKTGGTPLYGHGIYLAEKITKADEYAKPIPEGEEFEGFYTCLLCRAVGGRAERVTTNEIDTEKLKNDVFDGPFHSVLGDRVATLKKPYREVVVYDKDQVYPEFLLTYRRRYT